MKGRTGEKAEYVPERWTSGSTATSRSFHRGSVKSWPVGVRRWYQSLMAESIVRSPAPYRL